jgi:hypothetical protein
MCPSTPDPPLHLGGLWCGPMSYDPAWAMGCRDKERHTWNGMQQGSRVSKTSPQITEVPTRRANRRRHHGLQTVRTWCHATVQCRVADCSWARLAGAMTRWTGLCSRPRTMWSNRWVRHTMRHPHHQYATSAFSALHTV